MTWWREERPGRTAVLADRLEEMTDRLEGKTAELRDLVERLKGDGERVDP